MTKLHTHYDNLKVSRDAPAEVIRAAYKTLSQKYHPDKNPGDARAASIMQMINASYAALSDPARRQAHDAWIAQREAEVRQAAPTRPHPIREARPSVQPSPPRRPRETAYQNRAAHGTARSGKNIFTLAFHKWPATLALAIVVGLVVDNFSTTNDRESPPYSPPYSSAYTPPASPERVASDSVPDYAALMPPSNPAPRGAEAASIPVSSAYVRSELTPFGRPWPESASYLEGAPLLATDGLSEVVVDNSRNDSDVHIKLVAISPEAAHPVREFFIPAYGRFTAVQLDAGRYDVRYRDLGTGNLLRSEEFALEQQRTYNGTRYSTIEMTLYKVADGNMQTYDIDESEF